MSAVVAVLAGGRGRRMGTPKPLAELGGAPLIGRPLAAAAAARLPAVVVLPLVRSVNTPADLAAARDEVVGP